MNLFVLILIAIPLVLYLVVLAFSSRDFSPGVTSVPYTDESTHTPNDPTAPVSEHEPPEASSDTAVVATVANTKESDPALPEPQIDSIPPAAAAPEQTNVVTATADEPPAVSAEPAVPVIPLALADEPTATAANAADAEPASNAKPVPAAPEIAPEAETTAAVAAVAATAEVNAEPTLSTEPPSMQENESPQPILSGQSLIVPEDAPKYAFDYSGRLWVEKKRRGFFRQLRRPQLPPEDPTNKSNL